MSAGAGRKTRQLVELPGGMLGERGRIRLLEEAPRDPWWYCAHILSGTYGKPFIIDDGRRRRLYFSLCSIQSSMRIDDPVALDFAYTRKMMAFLLFVPRPRHLLMVGLGGGSLVKFCHRHLPGAKLTVVEVNPDVIALRHEFSVPEDERVDIIRADAVDYMPRAVADTDVLLLDAYGPQGIAPGFESLRFYVSARRRLAPGGVLVANFAGDVDGWRGHLELLMEAFAGQVHLMRVPPGDNHVAFAFAERRLPMDMESLEASAGEMAKRVPLDFRRILHRLGEGVGLRRTLAGGGGKTRAGSSAAWAGRGGKAHL